jgi:hypothetical protein
MCPVRGCTTLTRETSEGSLPSFVTLSQTARIRCALFQQTKQLFAHKNSNQQKNKAKT